MRILLDTHTLLWFMASRAKLSHKAKNILADGSNEILLSACTLWEIAIKVGINKLQLTEPYEAFMDKAIQAYQLTVLPILVPHATAVISLPLCHRDPFDRMLVAQAVVEQVPIISSDAALDAYPITRIW